MTSHASLAGEAIIKGELLDTGVEKLQEKVSELANLPTLPGIVKRISRMVEDGSSSAADIGELISKDQVLSARLLQLVNSPIYGFPGRITSITQALVLLGFNVAKGLVLSTTIFGQFAKKQPGLWSHSLGCAIVCRRLAQEMQLSDPEEAMVAGLLHDLGKPVLAFVAEDDFSRTVANAVAQNRHIAISERAVFGVDHTCVGDWLAEHWHLPTPLAAAIHYHHRPADADVSEPFIDAVHVADILSRALGYGFPGDMTMPGLDHEAYRRVGLSEDALAAVLEDAEEEYTSAQDLFTV